MSDLDVSRLVRVPDGQAGNVLSALGRAVLQAEGHGGHGSSYDEASRLVACACGSLGFQVTSPAVTAVAA